MELELYFMIMLIICLFILIKIKTKINRKRLEFNRKREFNGLRIANTLSYVYYSFKQNNENFDFTIFARFQLNVEKSTETKIEPLKFDLKNQFFKFLNNKTIRKNNRSYECNRFRIYKYEFKDKLD